MRERGKLQLLSARDSALLAAPLAGWLSFGKGPRRARVDGVLWPTVCRALPAHRGSASVRAHAPASPLSTSRPRPPGRSRLPRATVQTAVKP